MWLCVTKTSPEVCGNSCSNEGCGLKSCKLFVLPTLKPVSVAHSVSFGWPSCRLQPTSVVLPVGSSLRGSQFLRKSAVVAWRDRRVGSEMRCAWKEKERICVGVLSCCAQLRQLPKTKDTTATDQTSRHQKLSHGRGCGSNFLGWLACHQTG